MRFLSPSALVALCTFVAPAAFASDVVQCQYAAKIIEGPTVKLVGGPGKRFSMKVDIGRLTKPGGHDPARCTDMPFSGEHAIEVALGSDHWRQFLKPGSAIEVVYTDVSNVEQGPDGKVEHMQHTEWTVVPPNRPYPELVGVAGPDKKLPDAKAMAAALEAFVKAHPDRTLKLTARGKLVRLCSKGHRCDAATPEPMFNWSKEGLSLTVATEGPGRAIESINILMPHVEVAGVALPGWTLNFAASTPWVSASNGRLPGLAVKGDKLVGTLRFSLDWIAARKSGDPFCQAPMDVEAPPEHCSALVNGIQFTVEVDTELTMDEGPVDCTGPNPGPGCG